jgi:hypothetical protein
MMLLPPLLPKSIERKSKAVVQNPAPRGAARHGTARYSIQHLPSPVFTSSLA